MKNIYLLKKKIEDILKLLKINHKNTISLIKSKEKLQNAKNINTFYQFNFTTQNRQLIRLGNDQLNVMKFIIIFSLIILSRNKSIHLFPILFNKKSQIILNINQIGVHSILNRNYFNNLESLSINGQIQDNYTRYNFTEINNTIILEFNSLTSCENMFKSVKMESIIINISDAVSNIKNMFENCINLKTIHVKNFAMSQELIADNLFFSCENLISLDLIWISNSTLITSMQKMFYGCKSLKSIINLNFDTSSITNFDDLFNGCSKLTSINLRAFKTENLK
jgi:surface protein